MRWLLHGPMTSAVADALVRHKHKAATPADAGLPADAAPAAVLGAADKGQYDLLTTDARLVAAAFGPPGSFDRTLVYLQLAGADVEQDDAIDRLFARYKRLAPGRIYTVTASRVKVRQLPPKRAQRQDPATAITETT